MERTFQRFVEFSLKLKSIRYQLLLKKIKYSSMSFPQMEWMQIWTRWKLSTTGQPPQQFIASSTEVLWILPLVCERLFRVGQTTAWSSSWNIFYSLIYIYNNDPLKDVENKSCNNKNTMVELNVDEISVSKTLKCNRCLHQFLPFLITACHSKCTQMPWYRDWGYPWPAAKWQVQNNYIMQVGV